MVALRAHHINNISELAPDSYNPVELGKPTLRKLHIRSLLVSLSELDFSCLVLTGDI